MKRVGLLGAFIWLIVVVGALYAPHLYFEQLVLRSAATPSAGPIPKDVTGHWFDDYFLIEQIDASTFAIGEPRYYQGNYSYLILGTRRALLFDAGSGLRDMVPVVRALTSLPVTVLPSHLHFDHVGALGRFERTALPDDPGLWARVVNGQLTLNRYEYLGALDRLPPPTFRVSDWWVDGQHIDLGGRVVQILKTPGHTPTSVSVWDAANARLFVGDFLYPGELYAFLPGASLSAYAATTMQLLSWLPSQVSLYAAHMQEPPAIPAAPLLHRQDLQSLSDALRERAAGSTPAKGFYPRNYPVAGPVTLSTGFPWNLH